MDAYSKTAAAISGWGRPSVAARAMRAFRRRGPWGFARLCVYNLGLLVSGRAADHAYVYDDAFDRAYGVDTLGAVEVDEIAAPADLKRDAARYEATSPDCFRFLIDRVAPVDQSRFAFIDLGSGKGRVLLLAGMAGFGRVVGAELGADLHATAVANIARARQAGLALPVESVHIDATRFVFPPQATICFMNNPVGRASLARILANIETSLTDHPREFRIVYLHCNHADLLEGRPGWEETERAVYRNGHHPYALYRWRAAAP